MILAIMILTAFSNVAFGQNKYDQNSYSIGKVGAGAKFGKTKIHAGAPISDAIRSTANGLVGGESHTGSKNVGPGADGVYRYDDGTVGPGGLTTPTDGFTEIFSMSSSSQIVGEGCPKTVYFHLSSQDTTVSSSFNGLGGGGIGSTENYVAPALNATWGKMWKIRDGKKSDTFLGFIVGVEGSWTEIDGQEQKFDGSVTATTDTTTITHGREMTEAPTTFPYVGTLWNGNGPNVPRVFLKTQTETVAHSLSASTAAISGGVKQDVGIAEIDLDIGPRLDHFIHLGEHSSLLLSLNGGFELAFGFASMETTGNMQYSVDGGSSRSRSFNDSTSDWDIAPRAFVGGEIGFAFGKTQANALSLSGKASLGQSIRTEVADIKPGYTVALQYTRLF